VHLASTAFPRVALYFENSILKPDLGLLAASSAAVTHYSHDAKDRRRITIESPQDVELNWAAGEGALVDGKPWPMQSATVLLLPAGSHTVAPATKREGISVIDLNAKLHSAAAEPGKRLTFDYTSDSRAIVRFDRKPARIEVDGEPFAGESLPANCAEAGDCAFLLPRGTHRVAAN
jgi:hypothetical protein